MSGDQDTIAAGPTDAEMLESAFAEEQIEAPETPEAPEKIVEEGAQPRDEAGRFAAKAQAEAEAAREQEQPQEKDHRIPIRELLDERDRRQSAEREREAYRQRLAAYENQRRQAEEAPQRPDPINDPEAFAEYVESLVTNRVQSVEEANRNNWVNLTFQAEAEKDPEGLEAAMAALERVRDPKIVADIRESVNPGKALMRWHKRTSAATEVGDDLEGFLKRKQDEWAKDPEVRKRILGDVQAEARGGNGNRSTVIHIPSVNRATGGGNASRPGNTPSTDQDFFNDAVSGIGRR